jgi:undecaprenyl-diphosphatase
MTRYLARARDIPAINALVALARLIWRRHRYSVPLSAGAAFFFLRFASEVREGEVDAFDRAIQRSVDGWRGSVDALMVTATRTGSATPMTALTVFAFGALLVMRRPREARFLVLGAAGSLLLNVLLKLAFHRARPSAELPYLLPRPTSWSFPSGHTMGAAGVIGSLVIITYALHARSSVRAIATTLGTSAIALVGVSRVYLGAHYPSDVLGGWLASAAWLSGATGWAYPRLVPGERDR